MEKNGKHTNEPDSLLGKALKIVAYPAAAFTGWWVTRNQIRHYTFEKLSKTGGLTDIRQEFDTKIKNLTSEGVERIQQGNTEYSLRKVTKPVEQEYTAAIRERMRQLRVHTIERQSEYIYKPQFHKALIEGFTAASIMLGGLLILANSRSLSRAFGDVEDNDVSKKDETPKRS
ncbi:MAG: hypothetical protein ACK502_03300 [Alphaproteobacteria bacterium]